MLNQKLTVKKEALEPPKTIRAISETLTTEFTPNVGLMARAKQLVGDKNATQITLLAAEHTVIHLINLPKASARQQTSMVRFAVEELIGSALEGVVVNRAPNAGRTGGGQIALVTAKTVLDAHADTLGLFPEVLMVPPPTQPSSWAVWREGSRALVRTTDGTGFVIPTDLLKFAWQSAGRPDVYRLADALPDGFDAIDQSENPPVPLIADLAFRFAFDEKRKAAGVWRTLTFAGYTILFAALAHFAIFSAQTMALGKAADRARAQAQLSIATILPDVTLTVDNTAILSRLAPSSTASNTGDFLPLFADVSRIIATTSNSNATRVTFRRLAWGAQTKQLVILMQTGGLEELQTLQQNLQVNGFEVSTGAANAGDGGAEAEMRITRGATQ